MEPPNQQGREELMKIQSRSRGFALLATALVLLQLLSGCGGTQATSDSQQAAPGAQQAAAPSTSRQPASTDALRIAINADGDTLDPAQFSLVTSFSIATNIYSALVRYKPGTIDIQPDLAEKWEVSPDGKTWTFHLRKGVKWQGGYGELTAQDVVDSYQRIMDPKTGSRWKGELSVVDKIEATDPLTVVFHLKSPNSAFLHTVVAYRQGFITKKEVVAKYGQDYGRNPVGTGAYTLEKWVPGTEVVLKANDDYYEGKPPIKTITFVVIPDENVRMLALQNGEVDIAMGLVNPEIRKQIVGNKDLDTGEVAAPSVHGLILNTRTKPLDDPKVRQALYMAIDREAIADEIMGGLAQAAYSELAPAYLGHTQNVPKYEYNPEKSKQLLAEAGYAKGFELTIYWLNTTSNEILAAIQDNWKAIGVTLKVNPVDGATWVKAMGKGEAPVIWFAATRSDPATFYQTFFHSAAFPPGLNGAFYAGADQLIDAGAREMDPEKRKAIYAQVQQKVMTDLPFLPLYWPKHSHPYWKYVRGWGGRQNYDAWMFPVSIQK
jgi:peptide/nickel transport system substrate-binding protein